MIRNVKNIALISALAITGAALYVKTTKAWPVPSPCFDFVTGGGWFTWENSRANFGFNAGYRSKNGDLIGHLNYVDHNTGMHVEGTTVDSYVGFTCEGCADRVFQGDATIDGVPGYRYLVEMTDAGEPGRSDLFHIALSTGYCADSRYTGGGCGGFVNLDAVLEGGNLQIHKPCTDPKAK